MYLNRIKYNVVTKLNPPNAKCWLGRTEDRQKVITIAHPEHSSDELIISILMPYLEL